MDISKVTGMLIGILKRNAPVRGQNMPGGWSERKRKNYLKATKLSPYPGNLKNNGIVSSLRGHSSKIDIGGERAVYAEYTEKTSFKKGWMARSSNELNNKLKALGGIVK